MKSLIQVLEDYEKWNDLTVIEKEKYLKIGLWDAFNFYAKQLTPNEVKIMQDMTNDEFRPLRIAFTRATKHAGAYDQVMIATDLIAKAFKTFRGAGSSQAPNSIRHG